MGINAISWKFNGSRNSWDFIRFSLGFHWDFIGISLGFHGISWDLIGTYEISWEFHGSSLGLHGIYWDFDGTFW